MGVLRRSRGAHVVAGDWVKDVSPKRWNFELMCIDLSKVVHQWIQSFEILGHGKSSNLCHYA